MALLPYLASGRLEAGVDEAGRGCLAGPVYAAAVILPDDFVCPQLNDSKQVPEKQRHQLRLLIEREALAWAVGIASVDEIGEINILQAAFLAMHRAIAQLSPQADFLLIDGNRFKAYPDIPHACQVKGDARFLSIAAASILAKTHRDEAMLALHQDYPAYDWAQNKGYPTTAHRQAIAQHGASPWHRKGFQLLPRQQNLFEP